jgi:hypothetical protein
VTRPSLAALAVQHTLGDAPILASSDVLCVARGDKRLCVAPRPRGKGCASRRVRRTTPNCEVRWKFVTKLRTACARRHNPARLGPHLRN